jgi:hypothetical protein
LAARGKPKAVSCAAVDALPADLPPTVQVAPARPAAVQPAPPVAAAEYRPASGLEADLCRDAGSFDWAYMGVMVLADAGTITLDSQAFQSSGAAAVRLLGPGLVGLSWGWTVGGAYLTLPQCSSSFARPHPLEGDSRSVWPLALSFSILAAATAPVVVGLETGEGTQTQQWSAAERVTRLVLAGGTGVVGSVMPYVLPPSTWRALRRLERLHAGADARGVALSYTLTF